MVAKLPEVPAEIQKMNGYDELSENAVSMAAELRPFYVSLQEWLELRGCIIQSVENVLREMLIVKWQHNSPLIGAVLESVYLLSTGHYLVQSMHHELKHVLSLYNVLEQHHCGSSPPGLVGLCSYLSDMEQSFSAVLNNDWHGKCPGLIDALEECTLAYIRSKRIQQPMDAETYEVEGIWQALPLPLSAEYTGTEASRSLPSSWNPPDMSDDLLHELVIEPVWDRCFAYCSLLWLAFPWELVARPVCFEFLCTVLSTYWALPLAPGCNVTLWREYDNMFATLRPGKNTPAVGVDGNKLAKPGKLRSAARDRARQSSIVAVSLLLDRLSSLMFQGEQLMCLAQASPMTCAVALPHPRIAALFSSLTHATRLLLAHLLTSCPLPSKQSQGAALEAQAVGLLRCGLPLIGRMEKIMMAEGYEQGALTWLELQLIAAGKERGQRPLSMGDDHLDQQMRMMLSSSSAALSWHSSAHLVLLQLLAALSSGASGAAASERSHLMSDLVSNYRLRDALALPARYMGSHLHKEVLFGTMTKKTILNGAFSAECLALESMTRSVLPRFPEEKLLIGAMYRRFRRQGQSTENASSKVLTQTMSLLQLDRPKNEDDPTQANARTNSQQWCATYFALLLTDETTMWSTQRGGLTGSRKAEEHGSFAAVTAALTDPLQPLVMDIVLQQHDQHMLHWREQWKKESGVEMMSESESVILDKSRAQSMLMALSKIGLCLLSKRAFIAHALRLVASHSPLAAPILPQSMSLCEFAWQQWLRVEKEKEAGGITQDGVEGEEGVEGAEATRLAAIRKEVKQYSRALPLALTGVQVALGWSLQLQGKVNKRSSTHVGSGEASSSSFLSDGHATGAGDGSPIMGMSSDLPQWSDHDWSSVGLLELRVGLGAPVGSLAWAPLGMLSLLYASSAQSAELHMQCFCQEIALVLAPVAEQAPSPWIGLLLIATEAALEGHDRGLWEKWMPYPLVRASLRRAYEQANRTGRGPKIGDLSGNMNMGGKKSGGRGKSGGQKRKGKGAHNDGSSLGFGGFDVAEAEDMQAVRPDGW